MAEAGYNYDAIPARALNVSSRNLLSKLLNPQMEIPTSKFICKDYRGLAELMNFDYMTIKSFEATGNPTKKIIEEWEVLPNSTLGKLKELLEEIERYDVIEDIQPLIEQDVRSYLLRNQRIQEAPLQVAEISSGPNEFSGLDDPNILTVDDIDIRSQHNRESEVAYYDAYVCFAEEDTHFVYMLAEYLESPQIGFKLCIKDRNLVAGVDVYDALVKIIDERCNRMLIILSPEFLQSEECKFQSRYASGLAIADRKRKLIPLMYKPCQMPPLLRFVSKLDFTKAVVCNWIWRNLLISIKGSVGANVPLPSQSFCAPLFIASLSNCSSSSYDTAPMLPAPNQDNSRSISPQPSISFPPTMTYSLPSNASIATIAVTSTVSSSHTKNTQSTSRSKWTKFVGKFSSSSSSSSNSSGNSSSGFQSQSDSNIVLSDDIIEEI